MRGLRPRILIFYQSHKTLDFIRIFKYLTNNFIYDIIDVVHSRGEKHGAHPRPNLKNRSNPTSPLANPIKLVLRTGVQD